MSHIFWLYSGILHMDVLGCERWSVHVGETWRRERQIEDVGSSYSTALMHYRKHNKT